MRLAARRPEIAETVAAMESEICMFLTTIFAKIAGITVEKSLELHAARAAYLIVLFKGAAQLFSRKCSSLPTETRVELRNLVLASMGQTLAEIAASSTDKKESLKHDVPSSFTSLASSLSQPQDILRCQDRRTRPSPPPPRPLRREQPR